MSKKILVIVESPGKISKIKQYLGNNYIVKASFGHIQDLDKNTLSIEIENNFNPLYVINPDKIKIVKELKELAKDSEDIILASDGDREGEAIAFSLSKVLNIKNPKRIIFNEITKSAIQKAIENPITINYDMVNAQQTRRLLDRLVGYLITPLLSKHIQYNSKQLNIESNIINEIKESNTTFSTIQSAGRVQSAVINIIINKENEILKSISEPYIKIKGEFSNIDISNFNAYLNINNKNNSLSCFTDKNKIYNFLKLFNKNTIFKIISIENKKLIKKSSAPFITSSLQQEASTKLHFSVDKTMKIAQKLYENGFITYMRSDCPNISNDAIEDIKKYIIQTWSEKYLESKNYVSKKSNSQDAHECIRPTQIDIIELDLDNDCNKLYNLIWKRTIASQMKNAEINVQTIIIDALNNNKTILLFKNNIKHFDQTISEKSELLNQNIKHSNKTNSSSSSSSSSDDLISEIKNLDENLELLNQNIKDFDKIIEEHGYFYSTFENIEFQGYLIIYDNYNNNEEEEENINKNQKYKFKKNDILKFIKIQIYEDYTKLPLRYNEAGLIKFLEKNSIGRPSTYASIISKILDRKYVEIKNIEGKKNESKHYELNKKFLINEYIKEINIGKEQKKMVPTLIGINVNNFMIKYFNSIININFTSNLESHLDKIAKGNANWVTVLKNFYDMFEPIINNLKNDLKNILNNNNDVNNKLLGKLNNNEIYLGSGKYGPYIKIFKNNKWIYKSLNDLNPEKITLEDAYELLQFPRKIGKIDNKLVTLNKGKYGLYLIFNEKNYSINNKIIDYKIIDINFAKKIINK